MPSLDSFIEIWFAGGWVMIPLLVLSLMIYGIAVQLIIYFKRSRFRSIPEETWMDWIANPEKGEGEIGEMIRYTQDGSHTMRSLQSKFVEVSTSRLPEIDQRLTLMGVLVAAAPLLGLLGTVLGMLKTFDGISIGGTKTADVIAKGISEALITTEMGLLVALPGYVFISLLKSRRSEFVAFLARIESQTIQKYKRGDRKVPSVSSRQPVAAGNAALNDNQSVASGNSSDSRGIE